MVIYANALEQLQHHYFGIKALPGHQELYKTMQEIQTSLTSSPFHRLVAKQKNQTNIQPCQPSGKGQLAFLKHLPDYPLSLVVSYLHNAKDITLKKASKTLHTQTSLAIDTAQKQLEQQATEKLAALFPSIQPKEKQSQSFLNKRNTKPY